MRRTDTDFLGDSDYSANEDEIMLVNLLGKGKLIPAYLAGDWIKCNIRFVNAKVLVVITKQSDSENEIIVNRGWGRYWLETKELFCNRCIVDKYYLKTAISRVKDVIL